MIRCPASAPPSVSITPRAPTEHGRPNRGTLVHRAVESWIKDESYREADPGARLVTIADSCVTDSGYPAPRDWQETRSRLRVKARKLADVVSSRTVSQVISENELYDRELKLWGIPDLLLLGDRPILLDLKTEHLGPGSIPESITFQLNIYAHLVLVNHGMFPDRTDVFSLERGLRPAPVTEESVKSALGLVADARARDRDATFPDHEVCRFCDRRFRCEPHWRAAAAWDEPDGLEGEVVDTEASSNGLTAILVRHAEREEWVTKVPSAIVQEEARGRHVRLVRLGHFAPESEDLKARWRWIRTSALQFQD